MITAYLNFDGNTEEAFNFYKDALAGQLKTLSRFGETEHGGKLSEADKQKIMHAHLEAPNGIQLMGSDHIEMFAGTKFLAGNNFALALDASGKEQADNYFEKLAAGGKVLMPMDKTFWGAYFGMFIDKYGIMWMINADLKN
jgi:PhnB protein